MAAMWCCDGAVLGFQLSVPTITGLISINPEVFPIDPLNASVLSNKVKINGNRVFTNIGFEVSGATNGICTQSVPCYGSLVGASIKNLVDLGQKVVFDDVISTVLITGVSGGSPCSFSATIKVINSGQIYVMGT